jgi:tRNA-dihydrouridine synthase A
MSTFRLSVAPMVQVTNRPHRYLTRLLSPNATLYTEMCTDEVLLHAKEELVKDLLTPEVDRVVLQLAGHVPERVAAAALLGQDAGFFEVNLNCGCPSKKVASQSCNGAALMRHPELVREIVRECTRRVHIPVTVKCRLGVDDCDSFEAVTAFVRAASTGGARRFAIHARKGVLGGLGTKANRSVPPLKYDWVYRLVGEFPELQFELNGGLNCLEDIDLAREHAGESRPPAAANALAGCMLGRVVYRDPCFLSRADAHLFPAAAEDERRPLTRRAVLEQYVQHYEPLIDDRLTSRRVVVEALAKLLHGTPASNVFRVGLHRAMQDKTARTLGETVAFAVAQCPADLLDARIVEAGGGFRPPGRDT